MAEIGHGGKEIVERILGPAEAVAQTKGLKSVAVRSQIANEIIDIAYGWFTPLVGFMGKADLDSVCKKMRLTNGAVWSIPILFDLSEGEVSDTLKISNSHLSLDAPFSASEDNSLIDVLEDEYQPSPDESLLSGSLKVEIEKALDSLTPREAEVINLYFGLNHEKALTLEEIGARFSLTRERVRQIKEKAIRRLRHASRSRSLRAYLN